MLPIDFSDEHQQWFILASAVVAIVFGVINLWSVMSVEVVGNPGRYVDQSQMKALGDYEEEALGGDEVVIEQNMAYVSQLITDGASTFLRAEYTWVGVFVALFSLIIIFTVEPVLGQFYTTIPFLIGAGTSVLSGYIGMQVAVRANVRTTKLAMESLDGAFKLAFKGGLVLGFTLVGLALLNLMLLIMWYRNEFLVATHGDAAQQAIQRQQQTLHMFEAIAGYGLGGSTVALFGRVGGGIFTKAADVGADLVGKVIENMDEDSIQNPGVIADNVGDNVGDIAGMGSDLFGSFAESTCACMVISATSPQLIASNALLFPLMISAAGIFVGIFVSFFSSHIYTVDEDDKVELSLKAQLILTTIFMTPALYIISIGCLPANFNFPGVSEGGHVTSFNAFVCTALGLWSGLAIGLITEYYTSFSYAPVKKLAKSCESGAAPNIIIGLALGYRSNTIPVLCMAATIFVSFSMANMYGIALAALGMLCTLSTGLTIDGYGPISDNAGGIAEMSGAGEFARRRTDCLDAAGNTTAAIGKGFAIGSACLVALALFGAFTTRSHMTAVNILRPLEFGGLIIGAMLPYYFSAMTMEAVGDAAQGMIEEIKRQFTENPGIRTGQVSPDYENCIKISTEASIKSMVAPGALVLLSPLAAGFLFGPRAVCGLLAGAIVSGVQVAISQSNSGGAWDNAKKYIEAGKFHPHGKGSEVHKAAVIGDTVGDPMKDTSGPSNNILIKLMAITSLVFADAFVNQGGILLPYISK